jgi:hypothetical protein
MMNLLEAIGVGLNEGLSLDGTLTNSVAPGPPRSPVGEPVDLTEQNCADPNCARCMARRRYQVALLNSSVILEEVYRRARN